jgi:hypothetical protein
MEAGDWERIDMGVELAVHALNTALGSLCDVVDPVGQVQHVRTSSLDFPFLVVLTCVVCSLLWHAAKRNLNSSMARRMPRTALTKSRSCLDG